MATRSAWHRCGAVVVLMLVLAATLAIGPLRSASAASNGLWSVFPTTRPGEGPRAYVEPALTPGKVYADSISVANDTAEPISFHLYASDAINTPGGGLSLRPRTAAQHDIGEWVHLPVSNLTVAAHGVSVVPFSIVPPLRASPGDHVGGIVAEDTQGTTSSSGSLPVTVIQAVGVRIYGRVVGPSRPSLRITQTKMVVNQSFSTQLGGSVDAGVRFTLVNAGNAITSPVVRVTLTTPFGTAGQRVYRVNQLLPGNSLRYMTQFRGVNSFGHLTFSVSAKSARANANVATSAWCVPRVLLVLIVGLLGAACVLVVRRGRRRRRNEQIVEA